MIDATDKLLAASGLTRAQAIGALAVDLWPWMANAIGADALALDSGEPVEQLERSPRSGRWWKSSHSPAGEDVVIWVGHDASAEVKLDALLSGLAALLGERDPNAVRSIDAAVAEASASGIAIPDTARLMDWSIEEFAGSCVRLARS